MKTLVAKCKVYENCTFISCSISKMATAFFSAADSDTISLSQAEIISSVCFGVFSAARVSKSFISQFRSVSIEISSSFDTSFRFKCLKFSPIPPDKICFTIVLGVYYGLWLIAILLPDSAGNAVYSF